MSNIWKNWSGSLQFLPGKFVEPLNEAKLIKMAVKALEKNQKIRVVGAGHSSSPLVLTPDVLISMRHFKQVERVDRATSTAWVGAGLTVKQAGQLLLEHSLSLPNTGDVDIQNVSGAISTGTHGTGIKLRNLSDMLTGCRMLCFDGMIREFTEEKDGKSFFDALRVSLGSFGIMTSMRLRLLPAFRLERREWCTHTQTGLEHLDELIHQNRNFDFYWYPRSDMVKLRILNEPGQGIQQLDYATLDKEDAGWAIQVLPRERDLKFDEMEYAVPAEAGPQCFNTIRRIVREKFRQTIAWRVLYRTIKSDDNYLSPCYGRDTVTISLHHNAGLPFTEYFQSIEPVFREFGGRPHWGKKHNLQGKELSSLYPRWEAFLQVRQQMDPTGIFLNDYLKHQIFDL